MNWKIRFRELTGWSPKNDEERWRISTKSLTETSRKRYGSTSAWIFFTETIFLTNFERILNTRRVEPFCSALFPLFIGEKREVVASQLAQASLARPGEQGCFHQKTLPSFGTLRKAQVGLVAICMPIFTKYTPLCVFLLIPLWNVMELHGLRNDACFSFQNVVKVYGLRKNALFDFQNVVELYGLRNNAFFFYFQNVAELYGLHNDGC